MLVRGNPRLADRIDVVDGGAEPDRLDDRLASWAALAQPQAGGLAQVAAMLGVKPVSDPGLPTALALAAPSPAAAPVALAAAQPFVPTPLAATLAVSSVAVSAPSIAAASTRIRHPRGEKIPPRPAPPRGHAATPEPVSR